MRTSRKVFTVVAGILLGIATVSAVTVTNINNANNLVTASPNAKSSIDALNLDVLHTLINAQRTQAGLKPLVRDPQLDISASAKCSDMISKEYWSHNAPDGTRPWVFITERYDSAGENLANGFKNAAGMTNGWMKSPGHKANILKSEFTNVGYAKCKYSATAKESNRVLVVQHFTNPH